MPKLVLGEGPLEAKMVFIGEAPGRQETWHGRPFYEHAPAGGELTSQLRALGIPRTSVYITNVLKECPLNNDIKKFLKIGKGKPYETPAFIVYKNKLREELEAHRSFANVFVLLGGTALWAVCGKVGITKWRGSILEGNFWPGMKCIPTIHPVNAVGGEGERGNYLYTHYIRMDLRKAKAESEYRDIRLPQRQLITKPSFTDSIAFLHSLKKQTSFAFDIEVTYDTVHCISFSVAPDVSWSIAFVAGGQEVFSPPQEMEIWKAIADVLEDPNILKRGQNLEFDSSFLFKLYGIRVANVEDTMIAMGILFPDFPKGLDFITAMYTKEPYYKEDGKKWFKLNYDEEKFFQYNAKDSAICQEAGPILQRELKKQDNDETFYWQNRLIEPLTYIATRGIKVDAAKLISLSATAGERLKELEDRLDKIVGYSIVSSSPTQLMDYFYNKCGLKPYLKKGRPTTDYSALVRIARKGEAGAQAAEVLKQIRKLDKLRGTYYEMPISSDGRLRSAWNPVGTVTGRLSSSQDLFDQGGNMQNLPEEFRQFILADDDCIFYSIDLSQAENRLVAYLAPEPMMIRAFELGIDVHRQTAALIFNKNINEISDKDGSSSIGGGIYSERFWGKKANHSLNYDEGYKKFALINEIPERDAFVIVERYHQVYPGVRGRYHIGIQKQLADNRTVVNLFGRKRLFLDRWGPELFKDAYAQPPQSTVADIINRWGMIPIYYDLKGPELLLQIHDSIVIQISTKVPWERHAEILMQIKHWLEQPLTSHGVTFRIPCDIQAGTTLAKKSMRKVKVENGTTAEGLAEQFRTIYRELRGTEGLSDVDWDLDDSSMLAAQGESTPGLIDDLS